MMREKMLLSILMSFLLASCGSLKANNSATPALDESVGDLRAPAADGDTSAAGATIDDDTPVSFEEIAGDRSLTSARPWRAPDFSKQEGALGYTDSAFAVPKGLERNFKFWVDIYTKYSTDQGVLHDSENIDMIYKVVDFTPVSQRTDINSFQKERLRIRMVKEEKKKIIDMLERFQQLEDPTTLNESERKFYDTLLASDGPKKFRDAAGKNRLRFQLGQRDRMIQGIFFSGRYIEEFEKIFREAGLPIELTRLVFVESSFNVLARSKVGASGLWQIMPYTMKPYMKRDPAIDLRNHPIEATKLAAKLMRNNYKMLNVWPLAVTGYNHGPTGVLKLTRRYKSRELGELVENVNSRKSFGFASRNFYASFLAALEVESKAPQYFGAVTWSQPLNSVDLKTQFPITYKDVLRWFDGDDMRAQIFNPHLTPAARKQNKNIPGKVVISVPRAKEEVVKIELGSESKLKEARAEAERATTRTAESDANQSAKSD